MHPEDKIDQMIHSIRNEDEVTDGQWTAIGLLTVANALMRVSYAIGGCAAEGEGTSVSEALHQGLSEVDSTLNLIAEGLSE